MTCTRVVTRDLLIERDDYVILLFTFRHLSPIATCTTARAATRTMASPVADSAGDIAPNVRRTYGKAKHTFLVADVDPDSSATLADSSIDAGQSSQGSQGSNTRYSGSDRGDDSFKTRVDSDSDDAEGPSPRKLAKQRLDRKKSLKLFDMSDDEDAAPLSPTKSAPKSRPSSMGEPDGSSPAKPLNYAWKAALRALDDASDEEPVIMTRPDASNGSPTADAVKAQDMSMSSPDLTRRASKPHALWQADSDSESLPKKPSPALAADVKMASPRRDASAQPLSDIDDADDDAPKAAKHPRRKAKTKAKVRPSSSSS